MRHFNYVIRLVLFAMLVGLLGGLSQAVPVQAQDEKPRYVLAIHGGAGTLARSDLAPEREEAYRSTPLACIAVPSTPAAMW